MACSFLLLRELDMVVCGPGLLVRTAAFADLRLQVAVVGLWSIFSYSVSSLIFVA